MKLVIIDDNFAINFEYVRAIYSDQEKRECVVKFSDGSVSHYEGDRAAAIIKAANRMAVG